MGDIDVDFLPDTPVSNAVKLKHKLDIYGLDQLITEPTIAIYIYIYFISYLFYLPHDYNNYKEMPKKCWKKWRGGLKETIELMLIRPPQLQFFEDGIKITATDTK